ERPRTAFAANFLGDANFFTGRLVDDSGGLRRYRLAGGGTIATPAPATAPAAVEAMLAVRPEKVTLYPEEASPPAGPEAVNRLLGVVQQAVYSGSSLTYKVRPDGISGVPDLTIFEQNRAARAYVPGERVCLVWSAAHTVPVEPGPRRAAVCCGSA